MMIDSNRPEHIYIYVYIYIVFEGEGSTYETIRVTDAFLMTHRDY